ncbi:hypothetical protein [Moheibacter stercoris]|uniref:Uncharacterized protein n=1 Tax=Moheibacter stercoris TaxID=1628251 RepID=A0ABV2LT74_9FLAO
MKQIAVIVSLCFFFSCKNEGTQSKEQELGVASKSISLNCLGSLDYTYTQLLPVENLAELLGLSINDFEIKTTDRKDQYGNAYYFWKSDRPEVQSPVSEHIFLPDDNFVGISNLSAYNSEMKSAEILDAFDRAYKVLSDEEIAQIEENLNQHLESRSEEEKSSVQGLMTARTNFNFRNIENLGDKAYWRFSEEKGGELVTLFGNEKFSIQTKISLIENENLDLAKKMSQSVMDNCK